jgi:hypothetical protein
MADHAAAGRIKQNTGNRFTFPLEFADLAPLRGFAVMILSTGGEAIPRSFHRFNSMASANRNHNSKGQSQPQSQPQSQDQGQSQSQSQDQGQDQGQSQPQTPKRPTAPSASLMDALRALSASALREGVNRPTAAASRPARAEKADPTFMPSQAVRDAAAALSEAVRPHLLAMAETPEEISAAEGFTFDLSCEIGTYQRPKGVSSADAMNLSLKRRHPGRVLLVGLLTGELDLYGAAIPLGSAIAGEGMTIDFMLATVAALPDVVAQPKATYLRSIAGIIAAIKRMGFSVSLSADGVIRAF